MLNRCVKCTMHSIVFFVEVLWHDRSISPWRTLWTDDSGGPHKTVGEKSAIALSQRLPKWGNITCPLNKFDILCALWVAWYFCNYSFNQQVKIIMEQCWAAEPAQRPLFRSLIERFEAIRRTYDWQSNINFSLAQICWSELSRSACLNATTATVYHRVASDISPAVQCLLPPFPYMPLY